MLQLTITKLNMVLVVFVALLSAKTLYSQSREEGPPEISITSYAISVQELKKPFTKTDRKGIKRSYTRVFIVDLKGSFGEPRASPAA